MLASATAEAVANDATSASCYDAPEYVFVLAMVMPESKFRDVQGQIFLADLVIATHDSALQQGPERFDIVRMNVPAHVLMRLVVNMFVRESLRRFLIARALVGRDQIDFLRYGLAYKLRQGFGRGIFDHFADHVAFTSDCADDRRLPLRAATVLLLVPVAIAI